MAPRSIRKSLGLAKDEATIRLMSMSSNYDSIIEILIVKSTSNEKELPKIKYSNEILRRISRSIKKVQECVILISKRIEMTHDWIVVLKCLILIHRLIIHGSMNFVNEIANANSSTSMLSNLCGLKDLAHSNSLDYTKFVRRYGIYLAKKVELMIFDEMWLRKTDLSWVVEQKREMEATHLRNELVLERVLSRMENLQRLLQRALDIAVTLRCVQKNRKLVIVAFTLVLEESFELYNDIYVGLSFLLDQFSGMTYFNCVKTYGTFATVVKQFDDLAGIYVWCMGVEGADMSVEYPTVEKIEDDRLSSMEEIVKQKWNEERKSKQCVLRSLSLGSEKNVKKNVFGTQLVRFSDVSEKSVGETLDLYVPEDEFSYDCESSVTGIDDQGYLRQSSTGTRSASSIALTWFDEKENGGSSGSVSNFSNDGTPYVRLAELENHQLLVQEQQQLQEYLAKGMQSQVNQSV